MQTMTISRAAMDALRNGISKYERLGDGGVLRGHMLEILDRCTVVEPTAASAEAQTFGTFGHIGVDKSPLTHAVARASTAPALREVTDDLLRSIRHRIREIVIGTHDSRSEALVELRELISWGHSIDAAIESFRARLSTAQDDAWRCEQCGELADPMSSRWRWSGEEWQHHHDIVGHVRARNFGRPSALEAP